MFYYMYIVHVSLWSTFSLNLLNSFENIHPFDTGRCVLVTPWCCWWRNWSDQYNVSAAREKHSCEKEELWRRRIDLVKKQRHLSIGGVVFPVFFSLLLFCVESHIVLTRMSITKPSFPGRAAQTYHSLLMQFWCQSEVVFWLYLKDFFWRKKNQQGLPYPCTCKFYNEDMNFCNVGQAIYFPKKSICAPVGNLINLDM